MLAFDEGVTTSSSVTGSRHVGVEKHHIQLCLGGDTRPIEPAGDGDDTAKWTPHEREVAAGSTHSPPVASTVSSDSVLKARLGIA